MELIGCAVYMRDDPADRRFAPMRGDHAPLALADRTEQGVLRGIERAQEIALERRHIRRLWRVDAKGHVEERLDVIVSERDRLSLRRHVSPVRFWATDAPR